MGNEARCVVGLRQEDLGSIEGLAQKQTREEVGAEEHKDRGGAEEALEDERQVEGVSEGRGDEGEYVRGGGDERG